MKQHTLVFIDAGFLSKLSKHFGKGKHISFDIEAFSKNLAKQENLFCKHIFYYTAPPFQSTPPLENERRRKENYDGFIQALSAYKTITVREGRVQKLVTPTTTEYKQKGVDTLLVMDLMRTPLKYPEIQQILLIACDSDFVPVITDLKQYGIQTILYTYFDKKRRSPFSTSNELIQSVHKYVQLSKNSFTQL
ncbi:MAG: NYN domain-containing protein [Candidatus Woesearchaeota archaeon]